MIKTKMTQNLTGIFIKFFIFCLLTASLTTNLALSASISTSKGFCEVYKCYCPKPEEEIKCKFNNTVKSVDFVDPSVEKVDFSGSSLERFVFGDTTLSIKSLILSYNNISEIHENAFDKLPHLQYLDLSNNQISLVQEVAFTSLNILASLNLSRAFKADYKISRDICELINLKVLDLSYADLDDLTFECWKTAHLVELYLRFTKNVEKSWQNWFPYIGTSLKLIDLSNSDIINLDSSLSTRMLSLTSLNLANNKNLDKSSLFTLLGENKLIERIEYLNISNIGAWSKSLNINQLLSNANSTSISLSVLDVSYNKYNDDLNVFLFNQQKLSKLKVFIANNNQFTTCNSKLIAGTDATLLTSLEEINLASNFLNGSSCLYPLKPVKTLKKLDLHNNKLSLISTEFKSDNFISFFADKPGLKYVDFSSNQFIFFILYMNPNHTFIEKLDFSNNHLKSFRFLSITKVNSAKFPTNLYENKIEKNTKKQPDNQGTNGASSDNGDDDDDYDYNESYDYGNEYADEDDEAIIETHNSDDYDDDQRFIYINELNLSRNKFSIVNVQHMLQSIRNVYDFDLSYNPILQVVGLSGDPLLTNKVIYKNITDTKMKSLNEQLNNSKLTSQMASIVDLIAATYKNNPNGPLQEALCIDLLDLGNCKIKRLPNLQHTCINKINLAYNLMSGNTHLVTSKYSIYFMDYLDLKSNNITNLKLIVSEQKFKQDSYTNKNSPFYYYYGSVRTDNSSLQHTYIDLNLNKHFNCTCGLVKAISSFSFIKILNDCYDKEFELKCQKELNAEKTNKVTFKSLNKKLRLLFVATCVILMVLSMLIIYYMCSDCFKNFQPVEQARRQANRVINYVKGKKFELNPNANGNNVGVQYSKLVNETGASQVDLRS